MGKLNKKDAEVYQNEIARLEKKIASGKKAFGDPARLKYCRTMLAQCD